jgi:tetratricopeptide (TPR) repeat protein
MSQLQKSSEIPSAQREEQRRRERRGKNFFSSFSQRPLRLCSSLCADGTLLKWSGVLFVLLFFAFGCSSSSGKIEPKINYTVQDKYLRQLPSPFSPLTEHEKREDWGREAMIGLAFARQLDLYQAMTAFKRALVLSPPPERQLEIQYDVLLCYYLGKKYQEATAYFEGSNLRTITPEFPAYNDLLVVLYDCYLQQGEEQKASQFLQAIKQTNPATGERLTLSSELAAADLPALRSSYGTNPDVSSLLTQYDAQKKSVTTAKTLNAFLPGAGYFYIGQTQSGITALLLNGLFIGASAYFYQHGNIAAGTIFASFETGWYFGGIYGAGEETKFYNERIYEKVATPLMNERQLFPVLMLRHSF